VCQYQPLLADFLPEVSRTEPASQNRERREYYFWSIKWRLTKIILHYANLLVEVSTTEKEANITPNPDIDVYMKVRHI